MLRNGNDDEPPDWERLLRWITVIQLGLDVLRLISPHQV